MNGCEVCEMTECDWCMKNKV